MNNFQNVLLSIFKDLIHVFEENDIEYFLLGGTQLGATRHQGFVPWDDDIDIAVPRPDYDRLIQNFNLYFKDLKYLSLGNKSVDVTYPYFYTKIYDNRTTLIEDYAKPVVGGIYIDIFPYDGFNKADMKKFFRKHTALYRAYLYKSGLYFKNKLNFVKKLYLFFVSVIPMNLIVRKLMNLRNKYKYDECDSVIIFDSGSREKEVFSKELLYTKKKYKFEGLNVYSFEDDHKYLTQMFGEYMTLPPQEKRISHHPYKVLEYSKSYLEYKQKLK